MDADERPEPASAGPSAAEPEAERQTTPFLVLQFFVFPMAIVAVCVTVFVVFGLIAAEGKDARQYLDEVRTGSANRRWQAAFELSKLLQAGRDPMLQDPRFVGEAVALFEDAADDDPRVRRYLAFALGRLGDAAAVPSLSQAARSAADDQTRVFSIWSLGAIGDPSALPALTALARDADPGLRKAAVHALGTIPGAESDAALVTALADGAEDVRWNAALAVARRGDARAVPVLLLMLDRSHLESLRDIRPDQVDEALVSAARAAAHVADAGLAEPLARLRDDDPSLRVREAARAALDAVSLTAQ